MSYAVYSWRSRRLLVSRPTATGYGSAVAEILNGFYLAEHLGAVVCFIRPRHPLNSAIFELEYAGVDAVRQGTARAWLITALWHATHAWPEAARAVRTALLLKGKALLKRPGLSKNRRGLIKRAMGRIGPVDGGRSRNAAEVAAATLDFRRLYVEKPLQATLAAPRMELARRQAKALGVDPDRPLVTLHVRESGYKLSLGLPERATDVMRNASIENYRPAVEYLLSRGYQVVRIGDRTCTAIAWPGTIDLATSACRTETLELWCIKRSQFFIASDSGPYMTGLLLGVPTLSVNVTALVGGDPLRRGDRYILKPVVERATGRLLSLEEMLTPEYLINFRAPGRYEHLENSRSEILEAVQEMDSAQGGEPPPLPSQAEFDRRLRALVEGGAIADWRSAAGLPRALFVGAGRIVDAFARRHLSAQAAHA